MPNKDPKKKREYNTKWARDRRRSDPEFLAKENARRKKNADKNPERENQRRIKNQAKYKREVLTHYGPNGILGCCWESCSVVDIDTLSLDHLKDDGATHRKATGCAGSSMYCWVRRNNFPPLFQTLCMNHQVKKKLLNYRNRT